MGRDELLLVLLFLAAAIFVWAIGRRVPSQSNLPSIPPFRSMANGDSRHDLFRGVTLHVFLRSCGENWADLIDVRSDLPRYVIAVVTVGRWSGRPEFVTRFTTSSGDELVKRWTPGREKSAAPAAGVFVLPENVTGGRTEIRPAADETA